MRQYRVIYQLHKIFSIVVGIQLALWVVSGLYMTAVPLSYVHGDHLRTKATPAALDSEFLPTVIQNALKDQPQTIVTSVRMFQRFGQPIYLLETNTNSILIDAITSNIIPELTPEQATQIATAAYQGEGKVISARRITNYQDTPEIKGRDLPIWQVNFDDWVSTSLYVSNTTAQVTTARSAIWRIFDFFWMLHIMDYDEREDFNNPLVIFMASAGILLVLSGAILLINGLNRSGRDYLRQ